MGLKMNWITAHLDFVLFTLSMVMLVGGYVLGYAIGIEKGTDNGFQAGADLTKRQYTRNGWTKMGDGYLVSLRDGEITREVHVLD